MLMKVLIAGFAMTSFYAIASEDSLELWVNESLLREETLLCKSEADGDYFLVALVDDGLKTGYRIDVTSESGVPQSFVISWRFQDAAGRPLGTAKEPEVLRSAYVRSGDRLYAEEFVVRDIPVVGVETVRMIASLNKYPDSSEAPRSGSDPELAKIVECVVRTK